MFQPVVRSLNKIEQYFPIREIYCGSPQFFVKRRVMQQIKILYHQESCRLIIRIQSRNPPELVKSLSVKVFRMLYQLLNVHVLIICSYLLQRRLRELLPIRHSGIENLVTKVFTHLCHELFLYGSKAFCCLIRSGSRK